MNLYSLVLGSNTATWRGLFSIGKTLAYWFSEPFLHQAGLSMPRTVSAIQTRPLPSNMALWLLALVSHRTSSPQSADGAVGLIAAAWAGRGETGMPASATGILK